MLKACDHTLHWIVKTVVTLLISISRVLYVFVCVLCSRWNNLTCSKTDAAQLIEFVAAVESGGAVGTGHAWVG